MTDAKNLVAVSQEDREAAIPHMPANTLAECERMADVKFGRFDRHPLVQAFARHRLAHSAPSGEVERLREALEPFARIVPSSIYSADGSEAEEYCVTLGRLNNKADFTGADLARARSALSIRGGE